MKKQVENILKQINESIDFILSKLYLIILLVLVFFGMNLFLFYKIFVP